MKAPIFAATPRGALSGDHTNTLRYFRDNAANPPTKEQKPIAIPKKPTKGGVITIPGIKGIFVSVPITEGICKLLSETKKAKQRPSKPLDSKEELRQDAEEIPRHSRCGSMIHKESRQSLHWQPHRYSTEMLYDTEDHSKETVPPTLSAIATPRNVFISVPFKQSIENNAKKERERSSTVHEKKKERTETEKLLQIIREKEAVISQMESRNKELEDKVNKLMKKSCKKNVAEENQADKASALIEQLKAISKAHRKNTPRKPATKGRRHRNDLNNNSRSENILLKSSPEANEPLHNELFEKPTFRQSMPNSTKAAGAKKIVFYELPYSPNPKITRAQLEAFKQFHNTNPLQRVRNSVSGETAGLRAGESTKDTNHKGATGSTSGSRKRGVKGKRNLKVELEKLKGRILGLVQIADGQNKLLKKIGYA